MSKPGSSIVFNPVLEARTLELKLLLMTNKHSGLTSTQCQSFWHPEKLDHSPDVPGCGCCDMDLVGLCA